MNRSKTGVRSKLFEMVNASTKCYFMQNRILEWSQVRKPHTMMTLDQNIRFSISNSEKNHKNRIFIFNIRGLGPQLQLKIDNQHDVQYCIKYLGAYGCGYGLQSITIEFEKVGKGNFATVYKFASTYNSVKAMKMFEKKRLQLHKNKLSFLNEISIMRQLKSPYLTSLDCIFQTEKNYYLQMEYFEETLKTYLKRQITRSQQKLIMKNLLYGLKEMKASNIVHRDIKPDNIMVRKNGTAETQFVIIDFGLSARLHQEQTIHKKCGTPGFIAPEIANMSQKSAINCQSDIFSLGVTFFYILTKQKPFSASNNREMLLKNKKMIIEEHLFYYISQKQADLVKKMMERDPQKRITAEDALNHCYFDEQVDENDLISEQECDLDSKLKEIKIMDTSFMSEGIVLLYSIFKFANIKTQAKEQFTKCFGETEFHQIESSGESLETEINEVINRKHHERKMSRFDVRGQSPTKDQEEMD